MLIRLSHIVEKDRKLMMYVVEAYYKASADSRVEVEMDAAATRVCPPPLFNSIRY